MPRGPRRTGNALNDSLDDMTNDGRPSASESILAAATDLGFAFVLWTFWSAAFVFSCYFWLWLASRIADALRS